MTDHAYIYLLQDGSDINTHIYKIGRTVQRGGDSRKLRRLQEYSKGTIVYNTFHVPLDIVNSIEDKIKQLFVSKYKLVRGLEWFEGDVSLMKKDIDTLIETNITSSELSPDNTVINISEEVTIYTTVESALRSNLILQEDKNRLLKTLKVLIDNGSSTIYDLWPVCINNNYYLYKVYMDRRLVDAGKHIELQCAKSTITIGEDVSFDTYMKFACKCDYLCDCCMNTRIMYAFMDEDHEYNYVSCPHCYSGNDWENDMFPCITK